MFEAVILAFAINGYASLRDLEKLCKYDIRFKFIMNGSTLFLAKLWKVYQR